MRESLFSRSQLQLPEFHKCVKRYDKSKERLTFSYLDQFLCMAFAQLTYRESLRDVEGCLRAHKAKLYHLGIRGGIARSTLADANENRDWRIFQDFALHLIKITRALYADDRFGVDLDNTVYALVALVKKQLKIESSLYTILQILSLSIYEKTPLNQLLNEKENAIQTDGSPNQLYLLDF